MADQDREKALETALANIEKQFGKGAMMRLGDDVAQEVPAIPTGALTLDVALGVGGLPRGRVVELYGPEASGKTTVALHILAEAQKQGGIAAFIDAEHALDPTYAKAIGLDTDELLVSQPDTGEQALEIMDMLIRSGAVDVIAVDSVAALTPKAEIEGEMGDSHVGLQARLMSQAMRKLAGSLKKSSTCALFINQIREKIGVMFGCMSYSTRVTLADGTQEKIGKIVNQRMPVEVLSYDFDRGEFAPRRVVDWFDNGRTDEFLKFVVARGGGNGRSQFATTPNHQISTPHGWIAAGDLEVGDTVLQSVPHYLSDFQWEVVLGGLMGDGALSPTRSGHGARFRFGHSSSQVDYADWKASLFDNVNVSRSTNDKGAVFFDVQPLPELADLRDAVYWDGGKALNHDYLKRLTPLSIAIWYQDDGGFQIRSKGKQTRSGEITGRAEICVEALEETSRQRLRDHLADTWDIEAKLCDRAGNASFVFPAAETDKLHQLVASYVHPSMDYKLLPQYRGRFDVEPELGEVEMRPVPMPILEITPKAPNGRHTHRYDIEVEGDHNYLVDGVMVHNSPETTPGGRALKFYSSVRLDIRRIETLKDGKDAVGNRCRVKVVKNKCVAAGTRVFDPETGLTHTIEEIVDDGEGASVWATDKRGRLEVRPIGARLNQGEQEVIDLVLRDGTELSVTPDHKILTEHGWQQAGELAVGDRVARPRRAGSFGDREPVPPHHARMLGYLIGDGYVGGKTPVAFINTEEVLHDDAAEIADELGCRTRYTHDGMHAHFSHRIGEANELLELTRWAGIYGHLAPEKRFPAELLREGVSREVLGNLVFGIWESDGWISREQTGGIRVGFATTSEQLAWQLHWALLRFGIVSTVKMHEPGSRRSLIEGRRIEGKVPCWQVRVSGIDNVHRFAASVPTWGPKGQRLEEVLDDPELAKHRGSRAVYLPASVTEPIRNYLADLGVRAKEAAGMIGPCAGDPRGGMKQVLGSTRIRRDRLAALANALDSEFLWNILAEEVYYERIHAISEPRVEKTYDIEVEELHNFVADGVVVHNCAPPFRQAEFDIVYGEGISKEGTLLDLGVEEGLIRKAGAWYSYDDEQLGQGRENAREFLREHEDIALDLEKRVKDELGIAPLAAEGEDAEADGEDTDGGEED